MTRVYVARHVCGTHQMLSTPIELGVLIPGSHIRNVQRWQVTSKGPIAKGQGAPFLSPGAVFR